MGYVACIGGMRNAYTNLIRKHEGTDWFGDLGLHRIILK
jgi:hypothetical protein